jgi:hypothetical protein
VLWPRLTKLQDVEILLGCAVEIKHERIGATEKYISSSSHPHLQFYRIFVYDVGFYTGEVVSAEVGTKAEVAG